MEKRTPPLISPGDLKTRIDEGDVVIVDARGGGDANDRYAAGHLAGALMVNLETDLSSIVPDAARGGRHPLPDPQRFGALLGELGITPSSAVFVYDDKAGANAAARFWWMMKAIGHERIQVIDGGLGAIRQTALPVTKGAQAVPIAAAPYPVTSWQLPIADMDTVDRMRTGRDTLVIDVRERFRYRGESEPIDLVAGHIPGAVNIPYIDNLEANGRFRPPEELAQMYKAAVGSRESANIAVHCGSGVTACHALLAMDAAGLPIPKLYVGSWSEWSRNEKPVAKGENP